MDQGLAERWTGARTVRGSVSSSLCGDLWESGTAREGCGCYQLCGLNAHLHCYWHINYLCQRDSERKGFGSGMWHRPQDMDSSLPRLAPWAPKKPLLELKWNPKSQVSGCWQQPPPGLRQQWREKRPSESSEVGSTCEEAVWCRWAGGSHICGVHDPLSLSTWMPRWRREEILFLGNGIGFWVQPTEEKAGYPWTGRSKEGKWRDSEVSLFLELETT